MGLVQWTFSCVISHSLVSGDAKDSLLGWGAVPGYNLEVRRLTETQD